MVAVWVWVIVWLTVWVDVNVIAGGTDIVVTREVDVEVIETETV